MADRALKNKLLMVAGPDLLWRELADEVKTNAG